jgi:hypothetical protein
MTPQTHARLMRLLPKLSALTDARRLKVLARIDRALLADDDGATWLDIAERLLAPTITGKQLWDMVAKIEAAPTAAVTEAACQFLAQMRERAAAYDEVYLTARQREWLCQLYDRACVATEPGPDEAAAEKAKAPEQRPAETSTATTNMEVSSTVH